MPCATIKHTRGDMERTAEAFRILAGAWCGEWPFTPRAWQLDCITCGKPVPPPHDAILCDTCGEKWEASCRRRSARAAREARASHS